MVEGGEKVTTCIDSEANVVVVTVEKTGRKEGLEEKEEEKKEKEEEATDEKEVWVAEGEARRESLVLPGFNF